MIFLVKCLAKFWAIPVAGRPGQTLIIGGAFIGIIAVLLLQQDALRRSVLDMTAR